MGTLPVSDIELALQQALPSDMHAIVPQFAHSPLRAASGEKPSEASALTAEFTPLLHALAGKQIKAQQSLISFGHDNEIGRVSIGDIAGGHIVKPIFFIENFHQQSPAIQKSEPHRTFTNRPPAPQTALIGRDEAVVAIRALLQSNRLVTLTGLGGIGKSALAQTIAYSIWQEGRGQALAAHGVPFVALAAISSGNALVDYVRQHLLPDAQLPATDDRARRRADTVRVLADALNRDVYLCVFDNFESALDDEGMSEANAFMRELLEATAADVRFLITSRRLLGLRAEIVFEVQLLDDPKAVELFYARSGLESSPERNAGIGEICRLVDNLPLAVELAAFAVKRGQRPLSEVLDGLRTTPLDVAATKMLDYPERQQGLIASFRYTFDHLPPSPQRLFCVFTVFRGGADRSAVKALDGTDQWEEALTELVDWHLLTWVEQNETYRYSMLSRTAE